MEFLPGSLGVINNMDEIEVSEMLSTSLVNEPGLIGYKLPSVGVRDKNDIPSFVLIFDRKGILLIDVVSKPLSHISDDEQTWSFTDGTEAYSRDIVLDKFQVEIENRLKDDVSLLNRRENKIKVSIHKLLVFINNKELQIFKRFGDKLINQYINKEKLTDTISELFESDIIEENTTQKIYSLLEGTKAFEKKIESKANRELVTIKDFTDTSLKYTFKLDKEQRKVSMQLPQGPQRIRGLAGTGKTVILALKAALTHKDFEDFNVCFIFNTQSMYNQIRSLISDYYTYETRKEPNWAKLKIYHAWGGSAQEGFYSNTCKRIGVSPFSYSQVKEVRDPYGYIFSDLLQKVKGNLAPIYDMVLIDEAQDFPQSFFELVYYLTKPPKRIVWAYDEFQTLNDLRIKEPDELFGKAENGIPNFPKEILEGQYLGGIDKDFILSNSYRNPRVTLMLAHGLGLGIYRTGGIVDILPDRKSWNALGYNVIEPRKDIFTEGDDVRIERPEESSKNILEKLLKEKGKDDKDLISLYTFPDSNTQYNAVSNHIRTIIQEHKIQPEQIIVISLATSATKEIYTKIRQQLDQFDIKAITPGYVEPANMFQEKGFVTLSTPFRAKGNEAEVVFVIDAENIISSYSFRGRSAAFVSITRSRGWTFLYGAGEKMNTLKAEFDKIKTTYPVFDFEYPNEEDILRRRIILKKSATEIERAENQLDKLIEENEELLIEVLKNHPELLKKLKK